MANSSQIYRREFLRWVGLSSLAFYTGSCSFGSDTVSRSSNSIKNVFDLEALAREALGNDALYYLNGGADDLLTVKANTQAFRKFQIRARRLVDVTSISTKISLFGEEYGSPIFLSPVGFQGFFHPDAEIATAKAAHNKGHQMIASSVSNNSFTEIAKSTNSNPWFQLYPTPDRSITKKLLENAESVGCKVVVLTVDTPVVGNRERTGTRLLDLIKAGKLKMGNFEGLLPDGMPFTDAGMTWDMIGWLKENCSMKVLLKGIVRYEDANLALGNGADGIIVSNHGGRQLESNRATIDCLPEIVNAVKGRIPVLIDGGIRRGTDILKALAMGADAICIGRPYCWGLGAMGQEGVEVALEILQAELVRDMQLTGVTSINKLTSDYLTL